MASKEEEDSHARNAEFLQNPPSLPPKTASDETEEEDPSAQNAEFVPDPP